MHAMPAHMRRHGGVFRKYDCRNRVFEGCMRRYGRRFCIFLYCDEWAKSFWVNADLRAQMFARALKIVSADLLNFSARYGIMILWLNSMKGCLRSGRGE